METRDIRLWGIGRVSNVVAWALCCVCISVLSACSGSVDASPGMLQSHKRNSQVVQDRKVLLVPSLQGASVGWCIAVVMPLRGGCGSAPTSAGPVFAENCERGSPTTIDAYALTRSDTRVVSVAGGPPIHTRDEPALIGGLRAVYVEIHYGSRVGEECPRFASLDVSGQPLKARPQSSGPLLTVVPDRVNWNEPGKPRSVAPPKGACRLGPIDSPEFVARWGTLMKRIAPVHVPLGPAFQSCVNLEYFSRQDTSMDAAILLDAEHPGHVPAPLPGMSAFTGHPGVFRAPGSIGPLLGRRISGAWIVVEEGGTGLQEPLALLEQLRTSIHL